MKEEILSGKTSAGTEAGRGVLRIKKRKLTLQQKIFIIVGIAGPIASFLVFWLGMNITGLLTAFQVSTTEGTSFGLDNFKYVIDEIKNPFSTLPTGVKNTFIFFFFNLLVEMPLCYLISFFIYKKIWGYNVFRYIFFLPSIISAVVMTSFVKFMLAPDGPIPYLWSDLFGSKPLFLQDSRYALGTLLVYNLWSGFGLNLILYTAAFNRIPHELVEAGRLDGLGLWREIVNIVFPLTWPFFSTMLMLSFTGIFSASGPILLFTGGDYDTMTIAFWIYQRTVSGGQTGFAAALGWMLTLIALPIALFVRWLADKVEPIEY